MALLEETKQQLRAAGYDETRIAHVEREYDRRQQPSHVIAITFDRDEWNMIAEALQWQFDTFEDPGDPEDGMALIRLKDRILATPGVH